MVQPPSEDDMEKRGLPSVNGRKTERVREGFDKTLKTNDGTATEIAAPSMGDDCDEPEPMHCPVCHGELDYEVQPDGCPAYIPHDHTDDSPEIPDWAMDRPRGDY